MVGENDAFYDSYPDVIHNITAILKVGLMPPSGSADRILRHSDSPPAASMLTDPGSPGPPALPVWIKQKKILNRHRRQWDVSLVRENKWTLRENTSQVLTEHAYQFRESKKYHQDIYTKMLFL